MTPTSTDINQTELVAGRTNPNPDPLDHSSAIAGGSILSWRPGQRPGPAENSVWQPIAEADLQEIERWMTTNSENAAFFPIDAWRLANMTVHMVREVRATRAGGVTPPQVGVTPPQVGVTPPKVGVVPSQVGTASPCRADGACQYAIDHACEGFSKRCPAGKCLLPDARPRIDTGNAVHAILYDDWDRPPEIVVGCEAAHARFRAISPSRNARLFVKLESNTADDPYAHANAVAMAPGASNANVDATGEADATGEPGKSAPIDVSDLLAWAVEDGVIPMRKIMDVDMQDALEAFVKRIAKHHAR